MPEPKPLNSSAPTMHLRWAVLPDHHNTRVLQQKWIIFGSEDNQLDPGEVQEEWRDVPVEVLP